ncbi:MAG: FAD-dependent oxidoreductase [Planctomycetales bacterium]|nr:FAD-dependent oxidoreductase [Planctomycetales bacterium]
MYRIQKHPILDVASRQQVTFYYESHKITGEKGFTIAAALHQAGFPVHSHSLKNRKRSVECGIGKCGACEMLVDGHIKRICITKVDNVRLVQEIPNDYKPGVHLPESKPVNIHKTDVAIIGAGPAGLAAREKLQGAGVSCIVIDNNAQIGGQFLMQTHPFFFFEKEKKFGGLRGFEIAHSLTGRESEGIFLNSTVWDILEGRRVAVKNIESSEIFYVDAQYLVVATGAVPFMPPFDNDDLPGVYTAAVIQKMMNIEFTLLGKNILTVGAGNIGYLTSYQLTQAGARVKAIVEAQGREGGFPVQANRIRRLGIPIVLNHLLLRAIPNQKRDGIIGAVIAECRNFKPVPGTEKTITGIEAINICTGLVPDDRLLVKGQEVFGRNCFGAGDAVRIGEGTSAVLRGQQVAYKILDQMDIDYDYRAFLSLSKEYIDSQQQPVAVLDEPSVPPEARRKKPFVLIDCLYGFACNPCTFACSFGAITKNSTSDVPVMDYDKCVGCMQCVHQCPGLAIFGYDLAGGRVFLPYEQQIQQGQAVYLVDNQGRKLGRGCVKQVQLKPTKTSIITVQCPTLQGEALLAVRGCVPEPDYPAPLVFEPSGETVDSESYICHCDDVKLDEVLEVIGDRKYISIDEIKHTTRLGMGACRGKRCIVRLKPLLAARGILIVGEPTPRGPMSSQLTLGDLYTKPIPDQTRAASRHSADRVVKTGCFIAGGGIAGSALLRYLALAGQKPVMVNAGRGASWRNIAGGRPAFTLPELSDIAAQNRAIFEQLQKIKDINYRRTRYVTFAHNRDIFEALEASRAWSDATMIGPDDFKTYICPDMNADSRTYLGALVTENCWQASPGKVVDLLRTLGIESGGQVFEDCQLIDVHKERSHYTILVRDHQQCYVTFYADHFINALGEGAEEFAQRLGFDTGLYVVRHQAFITRRLPFMGVDGQPLGMLIDRRQRKGFSAVYGQQLAETGQIIGCASPAIDSQEAGKNLKLNSRDFFEIVSEVFVDWIPTLSSVEFQAVWSGYYVEPRMVIDPQHGLFVGLRGQGFMLAQYLAKLYVDKLLGHTVPAYFDRLRLEGDGLLEKAFK